MKLNGTAILIAGSLFIPILFSQSVLAVPSSTNYKLSTQAISVGTAKTLSSNYRVQSIVRQRQITVPSGTSFSVGEGFLRTAYFGGTIFAPIVVGIVPGSGKNNSVVDITDLSGANFVAGCSVKLSKSEQTDIVATKVVVLNTGKITCTFDLVNAVTGLWDLTVTNSDGRSGTLPSAFSIGYPAPKISLVSPTKGANNEKAVTITINGEYFRSGAMVSLAQAGQADITGQVVVESSSKILFTVNLVDKTVGHWDVVVKNDDNQSSTLSQGFKINTKTVESIGPVELSVGPPDPNIPSLKSTGIKYNITDDVDVVVNIYNMRGEKIWTYNASAGSEGGKVGTNSIVWNGITAFKGIASAGVYFVHVTAKVDGQWKIINRSKFAIIK